MIWMVNIVGLLLIVAIIWWFWLYEPGVKASIQGKSQRILVENGIYQPARLHLAANETTVLEFIRKDASPCAESVVFPTLNLSQELVLGKDTPVQLPALQPGTYTFQCQMGMYRGELIVG